MLWIVPFNIFKHNLVIVKAGLSLLSAYKKGSILSTITPSLGLTSWSNRALEAKEKEVNNKLLKNIK